MSSIRDCTLETCPIEASIFKYRPSLPANAAFLSLFGLSGLIHLLQLLVLRSNYAFSIPILLGCIGEIIGYVGRLILYNNPFSIDGFLIQICALTISPAFFTAAIYFCIADIVRLFGCEGTSRLKPKQYAWIFIPCDIISLVLQGLGGGVASVATRRHEDGTTGVNIMIAGLAFQVFSLLIFILLLAEFFVRVYRRGYLWREVNGYEIKAGSGADGIGRTVLGRLYIFFSTFSLAILCIFIRCAYRVAELSHGFGGKLIREEAQFIGLEGVMIVVAVFALNLGHPRMLTL
ncbi:parasitic phase-specific protein PSP-1 [Blastomyces dermatitidis ER-3]|uniref:Parasitic phase-specific protein PSP-1 n=3 Tax=Blastomyces TaxID=229219 RepID=A0A179UTK7_BLAGS|nr:parasitic phase-specific protein PSP-1 [Blastomyces gilchristii SLH14081]XP_045274594.1 parasitic phase-specific protein PSP-1 [Blastomyces dermatitidis ER-3]EGE84121.1 parasitic phase-specific protein PSP-1 [Blastomyces dermatitidis ATCC 18188]EQL35303.1 hypothetical protein BDFG_03044 [Blastomyces dermatitidis ATCC 26199]EEQ87219.2 parasitic phase-specific protein PSP-1 [Blastomyces dermatitidis ER-3]OAT11364.1 parasitic phase-specific protein PSP-1 [Blastomyces gilchristii SLH14081]